LQAHDEENDILDRGWSSNGKLAELAVAILDRPLGVG
jgi:hypothetical protein